MSKVRISGVRVEFPANVPVMFLTETEGARRTLPIYIGDVEAKAIVDAMEGRGPSRPLTHDLLRDTLVALGATLESVAIVSLHDQTYFAELRLDLNGESVVVSSRPSDAIALAVRVDCDIEIDGELLDALEADGTTVVWDEDAEEDDDERPEELVDEFREFLEGLNPEDFA